MTQLELNRLLFLASTAPEPDLKAVESLLKPGADPLGPYNSFGGCTLEELFVISQESECAVVLPALTELFLRYGMDVDSSEKAVLHSLTWVRNEYGVQTLRLLMDAGLSAGEAEAFAVDLIEGILQTEAGEYDPALDADWRESIGCAVRMILLLASYERVFTGSRYIRKLMHAEEEGFAAIERFRDWEKYRCDVVFRDYGDRYAKEAEEKIPWYLGTATVFEKESGKEVRKLSLIGYLDMERLEAGNISF